MSVTIPSQEQSEIDYPESDGKPIADNTLQFDWIVKIYHGLNYVFRDRSDVFVAADLFWYPVEGRPDIRTAPDGMVALGRPKGDRGSYKQWLEGGIAPQVIFEVLSPGNRAGRIVEKLKFYDRYGVSEFYVYDPHENELSGWLRAGGELCEIEETVGHISPLLGIRFDASEDTLRIFGPNGQPFLTFLELDQQVEELKLLRKEREELEADRQRNERLAAQLRAAGIEPLS